METIRKEIFSDLYQEVKISTERARDLSLPGIAAVLQYASDQIVGEYHKQYTPSAADLASLTWNEQKWPATTALLLEMKAMIRALEKREQNEGTAPSQP